jgi:hypothetical protein
MKKVIKYLTAASAPLGLLAARAAFALDFSTTQGKVSGKISTSTNIVDVVFTVINWILIVTGAAAVLMLIVGGFRYITSAGNEGQVEAAKETMTSAIFGLVIVLLAFVIASTINTIILNK